MTAPAPQGVIEVFLFRVGDELEAVVTDIIEVADGALGG
jgi:hypothetical protein